MMTPRICACEHALLLHYIKIIFPDDADDWKGKKAACKTAHTDY